MTNEGVFFKNSQNSMQQKQEKRAVTRKHTIVGQNCF